MHPTRLLIIATAASLSTAVLAAPTVSASPPPQQSLLVGHIRAHGNAHAHLRLFAWPSTQALAALPVGATVAPKPLGQIDSASNGTFTLAADLTTLGPGYIDSTKSLTLEVQIDDGTSYGDWNFTQRIDKPAKHATFDLPASTAVDDDVRASSVVRTFPGSTARVAALTSATAAAPTLATSRSRRNARVAGQAGCVFLWQKGTPTQVVEEYFTQANGSLYAPAVTQEKGSANHTLGIGLALGVDGVWSASGTANLSVNGSTTVSTNASTSARWFANHVVYRYWTQTCTGSREWRPDAPYSYLDRYQLVASPTYSHCGGPYAAGYTLSKSQGTSATYSAGVTTSVVNLSASSDWGTDTVITWNPTGRVWWCGNDAGPVTATLVETHSA
jgi:hypothetical protein